MTQTMTRPAWLLAIIVLFAAWAVLDRLLYDPRVQAAVKGEAQAENVARAVIMARVEVYAREIGQVIPALPVALVACVLLRHPGRACSELELKFDVFALIRRREGRGAHVCISRQDHDCMSSVGLRMLTLRHNVDERDVLYSANAGEARVLAHYANAMAHFDDDAGSFQVSSSR